jgi:glycosyltransferase involved in cell wall biosynthesis
MADCYQKAYGVRAVSFIPCLKKEFAYPPAEKIHSNSELVFVMAGQLYAIDEWNAFIDALELLRWEIYGKAVSIILLGSHAYLELPEWASCHVVKTGWRSQEDVLAICNNADFLYCPYWFSHDYEQEARLGFPAKLTTYMASGRPIIFHGPRYSSPARFIESHHAGFICDTINVNDICNILKKIVSNTAEYAPIARNATTAFYKNMTTEVLHKKFIDLFGQHN